MNILTVILVVLAIAATIYRIAKILEKEEAKQIRKALAMPTIDAVLKMAYDAEELSYSEGIVQKEVFNKYIKTTSRRTWVAVCRQCPNCGTYLPKLPIHHSIECPKCKLINYNYDGRVFVWR